MKLILPMILTGIGSPKEMIDPGEYPITLPEYVSNASGKLKTQETQSPTMKSRV